MRERLERLRPEEREILVLRGLEGLSNAHLAARTGAGESALSMRYRRALLKLKNVLPAALLEDLERA